MLQELLRQFGYPALVAGTFLEGELSVLLASYLAVRNVLQLEWVMLCAFAGTFISDQLWFHLGRRHGRALLQKRPRWQPLGDKAEALLRRHPDLWVLGFRFLYGLRTVMPLAIGLSGYSWRRYLILDAIGAGIWAISLSLLGFSLGNAVDDLLQDVRGAQQVLLGAVLLVGLGAWLWRRRKARRTAQAQQHDQI